MGVNDVQSIRLGIIFDKVWENVVRDAGVVLSKNRYMKAFLIQQGLPENFFDLFKPLEIIEFRELWK